MKKILAVSENLATGLSPALVARSSVYFMETNILELFNISTYRTDLL